MSHFKCIIKSGVIEYVASMPTCARTREGGGGGCEEWERNDAQTSIDATTRNMTEEWRGETSGKTLKEV